ncbi:MAG: putative rane protein [Micavibrio sp.]|nr:putative rane protein [Micavibrio sp.]
MSVPGTKFLKFALLPQVLPRTQDLFREGFGSVAYWIACIFANARMLPPTHPYLNPANIERFTIANVLGQALANLRMSYRNVDQIIIYGLVVLACALFAAQLGLLGLSLLSHAAHAAVAEPTSFADYFLSPIPESDISFMILDRIFGVPDLFNSCVALNAPCLGAAQSDGLFPFPYHIALQSLLSFYSEGLLFVAAIIFAYLVFTLVAETAEAGQVFGRRFNRVWAPLRLVAAIGLLIPMGYGLNAGQWIVLYVAKFGSGFGTNGWNYYVNDFTGQQTFLGASNLLVARPNYPSTNDFIQFMAMAQTCWSAYMDYYRYKRGTTDVDLFIRAYVVRPPGTYPVGANNFMRLDEFLNTYPTLYEAQQWFGSGDIDVVYGDLDEVAWKDYKGNVRPYCGEVIVTTSNINAGAPLPTDELTYAYLRDIVSVSWYDSDNTTNNILGDTGYSTYYIANRVIATVLNNSKDPDDALPTDADLAQLVDNYDAKVKELVDQAYTDITTGAVLDTFWANEAAEYGWAGAGIWYNKIAEMNGLFTEAVVNLPMVIKYPEISERIMTERQKGTPMVPGENRFDPNIPAGADGKKNNLTYERADDQKIATAMNKTYQMFNGLQERIIMPATGNDLYDGINATFKKTGLWDLRDNVDIHPIAQLAGLGKTLLTNTIITFGSGTAAGMISILGKQSKGNALAGAASKLLLGVAYIGLAAGILLYYVVPFMPFIYFFFAVVAWAKTIFEAMVGIPLWALAHMRYDGPGFPTQGSIYGYFLLLDIFIRPILIVFGLIASTTVFYAVAKTFNNIFDIVSSNLSGFDAEGAVGLPGDTPGALSFDRGPLDELIFTILYAVVLYMIGTGCFKMIDMFPQKILRWMRSNAQSFSSLHKESDVAEKVGHSLHSNVHQIGGNVTGSLFNG